MIQINVFILLVVAAIAPALVHGHPITHPEDTNVNEFNQQFSKGGPLFNQQFYKGGPIFESRDNAVDLEQRDVVDDISHPITSFNEHRRVQDAGHAASLREQADIDQEHAEQLAERDFDYFDFDSRDDAVDFEQRDVVDDIFHPITSFNEHRQVQDAAHAASLREQANIEQEHAEQLEEHLEERDFDDFVFDARDFDFEEDY